MKHIRSVIPAEKKASVLMEKMLDLRALLCKHQTYRGKGGKFDFFLILMSDRLGYNYNPWILFLAKYLFNSEKNTNNEIPLKSSFLAANYCTSLRASRAKTNHYLVF